MADDILVFYGSYRSDRQGIRLARFLLRELAARGARPELVDAVAVGLPMLDRMFKEHPPRAAPPAMSELATRIRSADGFLFVVGEYNWGPQPGLKNLVDHYLEEWFWRPAAIASYASGRAAGVRAALSWRGILGELGTVVTSSQLAVGSVADALDENGRPTGEGGAALSRAFPRFADDLCWWIEAARAQRRRAPPPY